MSWSPATPEAQRSSSSDGRRVSVRRLSFAAVRPSMTRFCHFISTNLTGTGAERNITASRMQSASIVPVRPFVRPVPKGPEGGRRMPKLIDGCRMLPKGTEGFRRTSKGTRGMPNASERPERCPRIPNLIEKCRMLLKGSEGFRRIPN